MNRKQVLEELGVSLPTFRKWCSAHSLDTNKSDYSEEDIHKLRDCQQKMSTGMKWEEYLRSLGKQTEQSSLGSSLAERYGRDVEKLADPIADVMVQALDNAVGRKFSEKLKKGRSTIFTQLIEAFTLEVEGTSPIALLEAEIIDDED